MSNDESIKAMFNLPTLVRTEVVPVHLIQLGLDRFVNVTEILEARAFDSLPPHLTIRFRESTYSEIIPDADGSIKAQLERACHPIIMITGG